MFVIQQQPHNSYQSNLQKLKLLVKDDHKLIDLLQFLEKEYPEEQKKFNLGSVYQIPIQAKGVELLMKYCFWSVEMLNLTMHKIENQGLQHIIKRNLPQQLNKNVGTKDFYQPWTTLTQLSLIKNNLTSQGFDNIELLKIPQFKTLRANNNNIDYVAITKFIKADWPQFQELYLSNNKIGKEGCKVLMNSRWKKFTRLDLNYNLIGNQGLHYLSQADWPELIQLNLSNNKIDALGTFYMKNANWPKLTSLLMNRNQIGTQKGKITIVGCMNLSQLRTEKITKLGLYGNEITLNAILVLLPSEKLAAGCWLELSRNHFKFQDIRETLKMLDRFCNQFEN